MNVLMLLKVRILTMKEEMHKYRIEKNKKESHGDKLKLDVQCEFTTSKILYVCV